MHRNKHPTIEDAIGRAFCRPRRSLPPSPSQSPTSIREGGIRSMRMRAILLVCGGAVASLCLAGLAFGARQAQQLEGQSNSSAVQKARKEREGEKAKELHSAGVLDIDPEPATATSRGVTGLGKDFFLDQKQIWTSPGHVRFSDMDWLVPLGGVSAGLFVTDRQFSKHLSQNPTTMSHYKTFSDAGVAALIGAGAGMWLLSYPKHNEHWRETGFLAGEAALNSLVTVETLKYSLRRERPFQGDGGGHFFKSGGTSFPSEHAAAAWSVAGVIAHEYPGALTKFLAYGLASAVSYSRVRSRQHFPSDALIGSVLGDLVAQQIYRRHHDPELGGGEWRSIGEIVRGDGERNPANQGSPYVSLDSWIYPALDRLAALGVIDSGFAGLRPWTRSECARLLSEAGEKIDEEGAGGAEAEKIFRLLATEFHDEVEGPQGAGNFRGRVDSVYARVTHISGKPLTDGYHFGQTIIYDYGRPYQEGVNSADGFSAS